MTADTVRLHRPRRWTVAAWLAAPVLALPAVPGAGIAVLSTVLAVRGEPAWWFGVLGGVVVAALAVLMVGVDSFGQLRTVVDRHPRVDVTADALTVVVRTAFRGPQRIERDAVAAVWSGPAVTSWYRMWQVDAGERYRAAQRHQMAALDAYRTTPNLVVLLHEPRRLERARGVYIATRARRMYEARELPALRAASPNVRYGALWAPVVATAAAYDVLAEHGYPVHEAPPGMPLPAALSWRTGYEELTGGRGGGRSSGATRARDRRARGTTPAR